MIMRCIVLLGLLALSASACAASEVILVRHAEKAAEGGADPALSDAGSTRAAALATALADANVTTILVTPLRRTRDTAKPLAEVLGVLPRIIGIEGGGAAHVERVAEAVRAEAGVVLVVGHSNTVPAIIRALGGPELPDLCETSYSQVFVMSGDTDAAGLQRWRYGAEDAVAVKDTCL